MSRIERLLNLTAALLNAERLLSAEQLRERVPGYPDDKASFRRQFERDKDALRELGLPLTMETLGHDNAGAQFGYRIIPDDYYLRDPGLAPDELSALHLAARMVRVEGLSGVDGQWKLGQAATAGDVDAGLDPDEGQTLVPANEALATIFAAIASGRTVTFGYRGGPRIVEPGQLSFRNGHWYLAGFDIGRNDERSFRVDRMDGEVVLGDAAQRGRATSESHAILSLRRPWELGTGDAVDATVRIDATQALWAEAHLGSDAVNERHNDGSITFRFSVRSLDGFRGFVLGFLDRAEIVSPVAFRDDMVRYLSALLEPAGLGADGG